MEKIPLFFFKWVEYLSNEMLCNDIQICFFFWCAAYLEDYSRISLLTVHSARSCMQLMFFRDKSWLIICPTSVLSYCSNNSCPFLTVSFLSTKTTILPHPGCNTNYIKHSSFSSLLSFPPHFCSVGDKISLFDFLTSETPNLSQILLPTKYTHLHYQFRLLIL